MPEPILKFERRGFPLVEVYEDYFSIKAIDHWEARKFEYSRVKQIQHLDPNSNFLKQVYIATSFFGRMFAKDDPWNLKVDLKNGGDWTYKTAAYRSLELMQILDYINRKLL